MPKKRSSKLTIKQQNNVKDVFFIWGLLVSLMISNQVNTSFQCFCCYFEHVLVIFIIGFLNILDFDSLSNVIRSKK